MMCSTWKISVFGIVALMLAFGLTAGDALAHSDGHTTHVDAPPRAVNHFDDATLIAEVYSSTDPVHNADGSLRDGGYGGGQFDRTGENLLDVNTQTLRATEVLDRIVFTYRPGGTNSKGTIILTIPGGWTKPKRDNDDGKHEEGEIAVSGDNKPTISSASGGGWKITSTRDPAPAGPITITYKLVTVPKRANSYDFGFVSNVVGDRHTNVLDGHLLTHARADKDGHTHRDVGLSVEAHTHTSSGITGTTFTIAVHTHTADTDEITPISAHVHRHNEVTPDPDDTEVHNPPDHAHDGAGGAVVGVFEHTHAGDTQPPIVEDAHMHAGDGKGVTAAPSHSHGDAADAPVTDINAHTHSSSGANSADIAVHAHSAADTDNGTVHHHTHPDGGASNSDSPVHEHSADAQDFTRVPEHSHDSAEDTLDLTDLDLGPDHTHGGQNGAFPPPVATHTHGVGDGTDTGTPTQEGIPSHTHSETVTSPTSKIGRRTGLSVATNIAQHVHSSPTGSVVRPGDHTHAGGTGPSTRGTPHTHTGNSAGVGHVLNAHNHSGTAPDPQHEHDFLTDGRTRRIRLPSAHSHADATTAAGNPIHTHTGTLGGVPQGPYATSHSHADGDSDPATPGDPAGGGGTDAPRHVHTGTQDDSAVKGIAAHSHTDVTGGVSGPSSVDGHTHSALTASASGILPVAVHKHTNGVADKAPYHTHGDDGTVNDVVAHDHGTSFADSGGDSVELPPHKHDAADKAPIIPVMAHSHASVNAKTGDPVHSHTQAYEAVDGNGNTHTHSDYETSAGPVSHSHAEGYTSIRMVAAHTHASAATGAGIPLHSHDPAFDVVDFIGPHSHTADNGIETVGGLEHEHVSAINGAVSVPPAHTHPDAAGTPNHVDQGEPHVHAYDEGDYIVDVGPAYSGSGTLTFRNTGSPRLAPETAEDSPYKDAYLVTKGQSLGDLFLTYTAAGTMIKGSGIRIWTDLPIDQGFYPRNRGGGPGGAVTLESGAAKFAVDPNGLDGGEDGITADSLYVETTRAIEAGNSVVFRVRSLKIKAHGKADEGKDPTVTIDSYTLGAESASPLDADDIADLTSVGGRPNITVTAAHKTGGIKLQGRDPLEDLGFATATEDLKTLVFTYTAGVPMAIGSQVEIEIPRDWPIPFEATSASDARPGAVTLAGAAELSIDGMVLKAMTTDALEGDPAPALVFEYKAIKAPEKQDEYPFITRTNAGPHARGQLQALDPIKVDVTGSHGAGTVELRRGGSVLRQVSKGQALGNLQFVYEAGGRMAKGAQVQITIPEGWSSPHIETTGDGDSEGEVSVESGNAEVELEGGGARPWNLLATTTKAIKAGEPIVINYKKVTAPGSSGSDTFITHATSFQGALNIGNVGARLKSSPTVGIDQAPDGAGMVAITSTVKTDLEQDSAHAYLVDAGESLGDLVFTFTADGAMESGSVVTLEIPGTDAEWPDPSPDDGDGVATAGEVAAGGAGVVGGPSVANRIITVELSADLVNGNTFNITYKQVDAPATVDEYDFIVQSKSTTGGALTNLSAGSPTIKVGQPDLGSVAISTMDADGTSNPLTAAAPGTAIGDITITFTASARILEGGNVTVTVPTGWSPPSEDNNNATDDEGEVELDGAADLSVSGSNLIATTNADLERDGTLVFTYKNVTSSSTEGDHSFTATAANSATGPPAAIDVTPASITVRTVVTAIAIEADDSFFAGESLSGMVTLWGADGAANALGDVVVMLTTDSETGSFASDSVTIGDNMPGVAFTYNDTAPGMVTLTATSGEGDAAMSATHDVTVKSGVAGLSVDPTLVKAGSDVTVTATGKAGGGTVKVMDSEGMQVGATKSLDPVVAPEDGDVTYSRTITLPADLADGTYTVTVDIQDLTDSMDIEVLNDQTPPALSDASVTTPGTFMDGAVVTVTASATSDVGGVTVSADVSALDSTKMADVPLTQLMGTDIYTTIFTISDMNTAEDGDAMITITATDRIKNSSETMVTVELDNVADDMLTSVEVTPAMAKPGETVWIKAMGSAGAEASATVNDASGMMIAMVALEEMEGTPGSYVGSLTIVEDAHPVGSYDVTVTLGNADPMTEEGALTVEVAGYTFTLSIGAGTHLIHVPLDVMQVDGVDMTIDTVGDLHDALGDAVNFIISLGADGSWNSYLGDASAGTAADMMIGDDTGLIAVMNSAATLELSGNALGTGGVATISLNAGNNLVGVPLDSAQLSMISDAVALFPTVSAVVVSNAAGDGFNTIAQAGDPGDGPLMGGVGYIVVASAAGSLPVIGSAWQDAPMMMTANGNGNGASANGNGASAAPSVGFRTPVLQVQGKLIDEAGMMSREGLNVTVKNLTSGVVLGRETATTDTYSMTFVKLESDAAKIGDVLEIRADSSNALLGIRPVQHVVTSEDVLNSRISLPDLLTYEIPAQTELLANYPNPFNPETWIPFRLAEDSNVSMDIYDASGSLVRNIDIGFTPAAVYEGRSDAIYWDGRNNFGEQVSSGIYFYHLNAGDFSATRKMVIVK